MDELNANKLKIAEMIGSGTFSDNLAARYLTNPSPALLELILKERKKGQARDN